MLSPQNDPLWMGPYIKTKKEIPFTPKGQTFVSPQKDPLKIDPDEDILILRRKVAECLAKDKTKIRTKDCPDCGKAFVEGYILERHKQRVHSNKVCACQQCDAKFTQNDNLQRHVRQVHLGELVVCSFCPYKAKEKKSVMKHAKKAHPLNDLANITLDKVFDKQYINPYNKPQSSGDCPHCGKYIKRLGKHIKTVHGQGDKKVSCENCGKMFCQKDSLERHLKTIHLKERFQCDFCQYSGTEKRSVVKHVKLVHPSKELDIMKFERHTNNDANSAIVERFKLLLDQ